ncbi:hypothetical protein Y1Q_0017167 [Alligator mississippiensis]|uniref:Uncharacterized protein n=1 Tax=Alligator mississippiensis TaxID=8496 RepID=A0A151MVZ2_ALLMI|nr:hypothetical protein Y1Q_0017167 [Alligator mississippiensis]
MSRLPWLPGDRLKNFGASEAPEAMGGRTQDAVVSTRPSRAARELREKVIGGGSIQRVEVHPPHPSWEQGPLTNDSREDALESFLAELGTHLSNMDDESPAWGGTGKAESTQCWPY